VPFAKARWIDVQPAAAPEAVQPSASAVLPAMGSIRLASDPEGAEVWLDGVQYGTAPMTIENVSAGTHTVQVRSNAGSVRQTVRVGANEVVDATLQIRPGWLAVFAPVRLEILEEGRVIGSTEGGRMLAQPGEHTLELVGRTIGFRDTRKVEVKPGEVTALTIELPPTAVEVAAPEGAEIFVDGQSVGIAPLAPFIVAAGTREIMMRHPSLGERRRVVTVTYGEPMLVVFEAPA
jgi:hypothetical protein